MEEKIKLSKEDRIQIALGLKEVYHVTVKHRIDNDIKEGGYVQAEELTIIARDDIAAVKIVNAFFFLAGPDHHPRLYLAGSILFCVFPREGVYPNGISVSYILKDDLDCGVYD